MRRTRTKGHHSNRKNSLCGKANTIITKIVGLKTQRESRRSRKLLLREPIAEELWEDQEIQKKKRKNTHVLEALGTTLLILIVLRNLARHGVTEIVNM